jgi:hypothetical protein
MYHDTHRQHGYELASPGRTVFCEVGDVDECLFAVDGAASVLPEREARSVMDELLRECLRRKPLD